MSRLALIVLATIALFSCLTPLWAAGELAAGFNTPPDWSRPWVYWFWLNGNITREGITLDLEAMARQGIGGVLIMEVDQGAPVGPVDFASDEWRDLFKFVCSEADRLGLEVNMNSDAGWNGSGGPWITPALAMQKVTWSETPVTGPSFFDADLPQPATVWDYYQDIAVLAVPATDWRIPDILAKRPSVGRISATRLAMERLPKARASRANRYLILRPPSLPQATCTGMYLRASGRSCASVSRQPARSMVPPPPRVLALSLTS